SMAAPQVCAVVAEMLERNPGLTPDTVKAVLMYTAQHLDLTDPSTGRPLSAGLSILTQGAGSVNAIGAVQVAGQIDTSVPVGSPWLSGPLAGQSTIRGDTFAWSNDILYGTQILWGPDLLGSNQVLWGDPLSVSQSGLLSDQVLWGDPVLWDGQVLQLDNGVSTDQVLWGGDLLWTDNQVWGDNAIASSLSTRVMTGGE
ncbi:MAG: S8 family serine peptidase, partial [Chloroflexi bacterium]|nr:S8 family serine peptidase [Chloroflexota bacterium]